MGEIVDDQINLAIAQLFWFKSRHLLRRPMADGSRIADIAMQGCRLEILDRIHRQVQIRPNLRASRMIINIPILYMTLGYGCVIDYV